MAKPKPRGRAGTSFYSNIDRNIHCSATFAGLERGAPCEHTLWLHLLTSKANRTVPGLLVGMGPAALAEELDPAGGSWSAADVIRLLDQMQAKGLLRWDLMTKVIWLPPGSPGLSEQSGVSENTVKGWASTLAGDVPRTCPFFAEMLEARLAVCGTASLRDAFLSHGGFGRVSQAPSQPLRSHNQDLDQDREHNQDLPPTPQGDGGEVVPDLDDLPEDPAVSPEVRAVYADLDDAVDAITPDAIVTAWNAGLDDADVVLEGLGDPIQPATSKRVRLPYARECGPTTKDRDRRLLRAAQRYPDPDDWRSCARAMAVGSLGRRGDFGPEATLGWLVSKADRLDEKMSLRRRPDPAKPPREPGTLVFNHTHTPPVVPPPTDRAKIDEARLVAFPKGLPPERGRTSHASLLAEEEAAFAALGCAYDA